MAVNADLDRLDDLVEFARLEVEANDLEPWALMIGGLLAAGHVTDDEAHWLVQLYNSFDSLESAWGVFRRWPDPYRWALAPDADDAANYPCTQERRNLRGGKVLRRLDSYVSLLAGGSQREWLRAPVTGTDPHRDFLAVMAHTRRVWGVGRQSAFEWAEFGQKALGLPIEAPDAQLWESEGPRRSIQRLYGGDHAVTAAWLHTNAVHAKAYLAERGVDMPWEDFETVICDFNVMRDGRYYPGRHLAALREEIAAIPDPADRDLLGGVFDSIIPDPWRRIAPGIDPELMPVYRDTGTIIAEPALED